VKERKKNFDERGGKQKQNKKNNIDTYKTKK
jgi:hypothetical protein